MSCLPRTLLERTSQSTSRRLSLRCQSASWATWFLAPLADLSLLLQELGEGMGDELRASIADGRPQILNVRTLFNLT